MRVDPEAEREIARVQKLVDNYQPGNPKIQVRMYLIIRDYYSDEALYYAPRADIDAALMGCVEDGGPLHEYTIQEWTLAPRARQYEMTGEWNALTLKDPTP